MSPEKKKSQSLKKLRKKAESRIKYEKIPLHKMPEADVVEMIHELQVHQIELQMQNEELRRAQVELEKSRSRYTDLYDFAPVGYFVLDGKGVIVDVNLTGTALLGLKRETLLKRLFVLHICEEDKDRFYKHRQEVLKTATHQRCELTLLRKDNLEFFAELIMDPVKDADGNVIRCKIAVIDINQRKEAELELVESNKRLQLVLESGNAGAWNWDVQADHIEWNEQMYEIVGLSPDVREITIETFFHYIHPKDLPRVQEKLAKVLKSGTDFKDVFRIVREDGEVRWLSGQKRVFRNKQAKVIRIMGVYLDITERQRITEAMQAERQKLRNILDSIPDAVYIVNRQGEIEYVNPEMEKQNGPWKGQRCYQYRIGTDEPCPSCEFDQIQNGETVRAEWTDERSGKIYDCIDAPLINPDGTISKLKIMRDVTERTQAEKALRFHEALLEALLELNKMGGTSREEILDFVREQVIKVTQSEFAFIGFMNEDESVMNIDSWSKGAMKQCVVIDKPMVFPIAEAGLWGEVVRQRKVIVVNDYSTYGSRRGCPEGHVPIKRFLSIPVFDADRIVIVAAVANKREDYEESDVRALTSMMNDAWRLIQHKKAQEQIANLARFPSENPSPVLRIAEDGTIIYSNDAGLALLRKWERQVGESAPNDWCQLIGDVLDSGRSSIMEVGYEELIVSLVFAPVTKASYVNIYGRDVTEQKKAEQALQKARDNLEEKVRQRTTELSDAVSKLQEEVRERNLAQQELVQSEARYRALVELSPDPIVVVESDRITFANPACVELAGARCADELVGRQIWDFVHLESRRAAETLLRAVQSGRRRIGLTELKAIRPDGKTIEVEVSAAPIRYKGHPTIQAVLRDITERKIAENHRRIMNTLLELFAKISSRQEYLDSVVETIRNWSGCRCVGIRLVDEADCIPYRSYLGFSEEFLSAENMLCLSKDVCVCMRVTLQTPEPQEAHVMTERGSFRCDNTLRFIESLTETEQERYRGNCVKYGFKSVAVVPIRYRQKIFGAIHLADEHENRVPLENVEFLENMAMLIGEALHRFNVEHALRSSESRLLEAQHIAHLGYWDMDYVANKLWWSEEVYRIFGLKPQQFGPTYEAFLSLVHPEDREAVETAVNEAMYNQKPYNIDHRIIRPDGSRRIVHERAKVFYDEENKPVRMVGTVQDISELKLAEQRILADQAALRSLASQLQLAEERERRQLASDLHDSIGQILALSKWDLVRLQKTAPADIADVLRKVTNQLDAAVKKARTLSFELSPSMLYDLGLEVALEDMAEQFSRETNITCRLESSGKRQPLPDAVKVFLYRSVRELLINVTKHAKATSVTVSLQSNDNELRVTVEDNGEGFDVSALDVPPGQTRGFGVLNIRERLRYIGGYFEIKSDYRRGTKVTLVAPTKTEEQIPQDKL